MVSKGNLLKLHVAAAFTDRQQSRQRREIRQIDLEIASDNETCLVAMYFRP
jgi:hypothetical protein